MPGTFRVGAKITNFKFVGDFLKALDDESLKENTHDKIIQTIVIAYLEGYEQLDDSNSLIFILLERSKFEEISHLAFFFGQFLKKMTLVLAIR